MWAGQWRQTAWASLGEAWDVIIIGGGITGAGLAREAARAGLRTLLVEQRDFAWGASSRSSKLVHGGLRYLPQGHVRLVRDSARERERLLIQAPGLVEPVGFLLISRRGDRPGLLVNRVGLAVYDRLAGRRTSRAYSAPELLELAPRLEPGALIGGIGYGEAWTDDARLVLRTLGEAVADGAVAFNYVVAEQLLRRGDQVAGVRLRDGLDDRTADVYGRVVVNATGPWADRLSDQVGVPARLRPLRGSHLAFPDWRLPLAQGIGFLHPIDRRYVFVLPWEGATVVGTTDLDHDQPLTDEPTVTPAEVAYLMAAVTSQFPALNLTLDDVVSTWSGVRPIIAGGRDAPSREGRDYAIWEDHGLVTVTGGKLTTYRLMASAVLARLAARYPDWQHLARPANEPPAEPIGAAPAGGVALSQARWRRLSGRLGSAGAAALVATARSGELDSIPGTPYLWAELRWAARLEGVVHLDDLLLRRLRLGLLSPALSLFYRIADISKLAS